MKPRKTSTNNKINIYEGLEFYHRDLDHDKPYIIDLIAPSVKKVGIIFFKNMVWQKAVYSMEDVEHYFREGTWIKKEQYEKEKNSNKPKAKYLGGDGILP